MRPSLRPTTDGHPLTRRHLLLGAGLAAAAVGGLSACSPGDAGEGSPGPVSAATSDIPVGGGKIFRDAQTVVTQPSAGTFQAYSSICTHARCPVSEVTSSINCNCHGSRFSLADGSVLAGPAEQPLPARTVTVQGDRLTVSG